LGDRKVGDRSSLPPTNSTHLEANMTATQEPLDLTTVAGVQALMQSSKSAAQWDENCDKVKAANKQWDEDLGQFRDTYPSFWYTEIVMSGILSAARANW
jgi:hypothetical protein